MNAIQNFDQLINRLHKQQSHKRVAVVCPHDPHTEYVITRSLREGIAEFILLTTNEFLTSVQRIKMLFPEQVEIYTASDSDAAAKLGVSLIKEHQADVLMKGTLNTDNLLRAVLDKQNGLLPEGAVLSHLTAAKIPNYNKILFFSDVAVIPRPTLEQYRAMLNYDLAICRKLGIEEPRVALIHCTEKSNEKFPHTISYAVLKEEAGKGVFGNVYIDGPMDVKSACDQHSAEVKGMAQSPVCGQAELLIFPNIEAGNTFYKTISLFAGAEMAGILTGTIAPVVVSSRADSNESKYYSLILACVTGNNK